jgi:SAM-dependent methyltransferase
VYDQIALHWHHTRGIRKVYWARVKDFLDHLPKGSLLADVGSGDGKYFGVNPGVLSIGCDRSEELLKVSWSPVYETFCCDAVKLPYRDDAFDAAICIAVMHHLASVPRRLALLSELLRIVLPGGRVVVQAWAQEQGQASKRTFESQDVLVPWQLQDTFTKQKDPKDATAGGVGGEGGEKGEGENASDVATGGKQASAEATDSEGKKLVNTTPGNNTTKIFQRYCHVYREGELEGLCARLPNCRVEEVGWDKGNWFVKLQKIS